MSDDDRELLAHYVQRGREPWNISLEASWLDVQMRAYVEPRLTNGARVCNIGIGVGLWDDWLGYAVGARITSVDRDEDICRVLAIRQAREGHPHPARILCGDIREGVLGRERFDVITCVGSTLAEAGGDLREILRAHLRPTGILLSCEARATATSVVLACTSTNAEGRPMDPGMKAELIRCACTRINDPWRRFCGGCGRHLEPACGCGFVNAKSDAYCGGCGERTSHPSRTVTSSNPTTIPIDILDVISSAPAE